MLHTRKSAAIILLVLFFVAVTPKQYLHFIFAEHRDSTTKIENLHKEVLSKGGYNCNCDEIVAESPFLPQEGLVFKIFTSDPIRHTLFTIHTLKGEVSSLNERGPPDMI